MLSSQMGHELVARALLENGAAVNHAASNGRTSLMLACSNNHVLVARALLEAGAAVNHLVPGSGLDCCLALCLFPCMLCGVIPCLPYGRTALDVAEDEAVRRLLRVHGAHNSRDGLARTLSCGLCRRPTNTVMLDPSLVEADVTHTAGGAVIEQRMEREGFQAPLVQHGSLNSIEHTSAV
jgi:hypothetical protein